MGASLMRTHDLKLTRKTAGTAENPTRQKLPYVTTRLISSTTGNYMHDVQMSSHSRVTLTYMTLTFQGHSRSNVSAIDSEYVVSY